eukprot:CAMPEP_0184691980 /NCGR_PEP_ID=MMETSP0313-20130426/644_1 /TAXON_ID=2792 /ORGANISM="Porphyridium aerugineum, Strain SAG 1380-2" /LENGTH=334 /DNA_ID=CAMNT_0027149769 /DNA_START=56 /DNA_END=1060 /DNA_ORIENTATION=+
MSNLVKKALDKKIEEDQKNYDGFQKKNPSHASFYPQFVRGLNTGLKGLQFALSDPEGKKVLKDLMPSIAKGCGVLFVIATLWWLGESFTAPVEKPLPLSFARWIQALFKSSRYGTIIATLLLKKKLVADDEMFLTTLKQKAPEFGKVVESTPKRKKTKEEIIAKLKRMGKMISFRVVGKVLHKIVPKFAQFVTPVFRFLALQRVLGAPLSATVAVIEAIPGVQMFEEPLLFFSESAMDSLDLADDLLKPYMKRLASVDLEHYAKRRFQGYLTGMGFFFELFMNIPIVSILVYVLAESAAAFEIIEIVKRNKEKTEGHKELLGESVMESERSKTE